jgi:hypothetical protein
MKYIIILIVIIVIIMIIKNKKIDKFENNIIIDGCKDLELHDDIISGYCKDEFGKYKFTAFNKKICYNRRGNLVNNNGDLKCK